MVLQNSEMNIKIEFEGLLWPKNETWRIKLADLKIKGWIWPKNETLGIRLTNLKVEGPTWSLVESWRMNLSILPNSKIKSHDGAACVAAHWGAITGSAIGFSQGAAAGVNKSQPRMPWAPKSQKRCTGESSDVWNPEKQQRLYLNL